MPGEVGWDQAIHGFINHLRGFCPYSKGVEILRRILEEGGWRGIRDGGE